MLHPSESIPNPTPATVGDHYFPAACPAGHRPFLVRLPLSIDGSPPTCPECSQVARFLPGAHYPEASVEMIQGLIEALWSARLPPMLASEAARALDLPPGQLTPGVVRDVLSKYQGLEAVGSFIPQLEPGANLQDLRNLVSLIAALLPACAAMPEEPNPDTSS